MGPIGRYMGPSVSVNHGILCTLLDSCEFEVPSSYFSKKKKEKKKKSLQVKKLEGQCVLETVFICVFFFFFLRKFQIMVFALDITLYHQIKILISFGVGGELNTRSLI